MGAGGGGRGEVGIVARVCGGGNKSVAGRVAWSGWVLGAGASGAVVVLKKVRASIGEGSATCRDSFDGGLAPTRPWLKNKASTGAW